MIAVAGCVAQAEGAEVSRRAREVDIVVGTGVGGAPRVTVFDSQTLTRIADFFAFNRTGVIPGYAGGVSVAGGDLGAEVAPGLFDTIIAKYSGGQAHTHQQAAQ